jgi:hypothetical protein
MVKIVSYMKVERFWKARSGSSEAIYASSDEFTSQSALVALTKTGIIAPVGKRYSRCPITLNKLAVAPE